MDENGVSRYFYNYRERDKDEIFPWDFIDIGVSKKFLYREYENSIQDGEPVEFYKFTLNYKNF